MKLNDSTNALQINNSGAADETKCRLIFPRSILSCFSIFHGCQNPLSRLGLVLLLLITMFFPMSLCSAEYIPMPLPIIGKAYQLVKNWDFGKNIAETKQLFQEFHSRYIYSQGTLDYLFANGEWQRYREYEQHRIIGENLHLIATVTKGLFDGGIASGMIRSRWSGRYGYFESRMKVPKGRGLWPAFWLNPEDGKWPPEIDIVEIVDNGDGATRKSFHFLHSAGDQHSISLFSRLNDAGAYRPGFDFSEDFHVFAVEWTVDKVKHYVDNKLISKRRFDWRHKDGSGGGPAHIIMNLAVGGHWPGEPESEKIFPAILEIDYIRVWQARSLAR